MACVWRGSHRRRGTAPGLGGLYQVNATLPAGLNAGTYVVYIGLGDNTDFGNAVNQQATIPVGK